MSQSTPNGYEVPDQYITIKSLDNYINARKDEFGMEYSGAVGSPFLEVSDEGIHSP